MAKYCSEEISSSFSDFPSRLYQRRFKLELIRNHGNLSPWLENFHRRPQSAASERRANGIVVRGRGSRSHDSQTRPRASSFTQERRKFFLTNFRRKMSPFSQFT